MTPIDLRRAVVACTLAAAGLATAITPASAGDIPATGVYDIRGGKVDVGTFRGWVTYHIACSSCHGKDAMPNGLAPDLLKTIRTMPRQDFATKVLSRYRVNLGLTESLFSDTLRQSVLAGVEPPDSPDEVSPAMPAWQTDTVVSGRVLDLYAFLKARSDGALGKGRPAAYRKD